MNKAKLVVRCEIDPQAPEGEAIIYLVSCRGNDRKFALPSWEALNFISDEGNNKFGFFFSKTLIVSDELSEDKYFYSDFPIVDVFFSDFVVLLSELDLCVYDFSGNLISKDCFLEPVISGEFDGCSIIVRFLDGEVMNRLISY